MLEREEEEEEAMYLVYGVESCPPLRDEINFSTVLTEDVETYRLEDGPD